MSAVRSNVPVKGGLVEAYDVIHQFWFGPEPDDAVVAQQKSNLWWAKKNQHDQEIQRRFSAYVDMAARGELDSWTKSARPLLVLILLTDQFPRNIYRNTPKAFRFDTLAQTWCLHGIRQGMDKGLRPIERIFFYLPLEHAESMEHQEQSVQLYTKLLQETPENQADIFKGYLAFALRHRSVVARFGRFPHRNAILGRASTLEETAFLRQPGSSF
jgi:uncharacterized protein (DUF924 family)